MKNEIKEILDYLKALASGKWIMLDLSNEEYKMLYDYITNLQDRIKELEQINEEHRKLNGTLRETINKAIEYMKKWGEEPDADMYMQMKQYKEFQYLLNILQNGEQNE